MTIFLFVLCASISSEIFSMFFALISSIMLNSTPNSLNNEEESLITDSEVKPILNKSVFIPKSLMPKISHTIS